MKRTLMHVITGLGCGGAEAMLYSLLKKLNEKKEYQLVVVSLSNEGTWGEKIKALGVPLYCLNMRGLPTIAGIRNYNKLLKKYLPDVIHAWMHHACLFTTLFRTKSTKQKLIMGIHYHLDNLANEPIKFRITNWLTSKTSHGVALCQYVSDKVKEAHINYGYNESNALTIANGFDLESFKPSLSQKIKIRNKLGIPESAKLIGMFARFHPMKNHFGFLEAAKKIIDQVNEDTYFLLAGTGCDEHNQTLTKKIASLGLEKYVFLIGVVNTKDYMPSLDIHMLTSSYGESFGMVLCEAMAAGIPCVATTAGDAEKIIGPFGVPTSINDTNALAAGCIKLLKLSNDEKTALETKCREHIGKHYSIKQITLQYENAYQKITTGAVCAE